MKDIIDNIRVYLEDAPSVDLSSPDSLEYFRDYVELFAEDKNEDRLNELLDQLNAGIIAKKGKIATRALYELLPDVFVTLDPESKVQEHDAEWVLGKYREAYPTDEVIHQQARDVEKWVNTFHERAAREIIEAIPEYKAKGHTMTVSGLLRSIFGSELVLWEELAGTIQYNVRELARRIDEPELECEGVVRDVKHLMASHAIRRPVLEGMEPIDVKRFIQEFRELRPTENTGVLRIIATLAYLYDDKKGDEPMNQVQAKALKELRERVCAPEIPLDFPLSNRAEATAFQRYIRDDHDEDLSQELSAALFEYATTGYEVDPLMSIELQGAVERLRGDIERYEGSPFNIPSNPLTLPDVLRDLRQHGSYKCLHSVQVSARMVYTQLLSEAARDLQKTFDRIGLRYVIDTDNDCKGLFKAMDKYTGTPNRDVVELRKRLEQIINVYHDEAVAIPDKPRRRTGETYTTTTEAYASIFNKPKPVTEEKPMNENLSIGAAFEATLHNLVNGESTQDFIRKVVAETVSEIAPTPIEVTYNGNSNVLDLAHAKLETVLTRMKAVRNIMLTGPAGCGKTFLAKQVADGCGLPFATVSCSADMSSSTLLGWLLPVNSATFEYVESDFIRLYENGGVFLLDEMDAADPSILLVINQALANGRLSVPQRRGNTEVIRHKDFVCIAACNTFGRGANVMYAGRERLDEATLDRFRLGLIEMDYDADLEVRLVASEVLTWGRQVREKIEKAQLRRILSTRFLLDASALYHEAGATINEIENIYFTGWKEDERVSVAVENRRPSEWF